MWQDFLSVITKSEKLELSRKDRILEWRHKNEKGQRTEDGKCKNTKRTYIPGKKYTNVLVGIKEKGEWQMERGYEQKTEMPQLKYGDRTPNIKTQCGQKTCKQKIKKRRQIGREKQIK